MTVNGPEKEKELQKWYHKALMENVAKNLRTVRAEISVVR